MNRYKFLDGPDDKGKEQHVHTLDGKVLLGTSTVLSVLSKPLTWWAAGQAVSHLGWTPIRIPGTKKYAPKDERVAVAAERLESIKDLTPDQYLKELDAAYYAHSKKLDSSAVAGTAMHAVLEEYVKDCLDDGGRPYEVKKSEHPALDVFSKWAVKNVGQFVASEIHCYSERLWTGGIVDLLYEDKKGNRVVFDFKSSKEAYDSHFLQDAGYATAISENGGYTKDGDRILAPTHFDYYGVFPFGMENAVPKFRQDTAELMSGFESCVGLYKLLKENK